MEKTIIADKSLMVSRTKTVVLSLGLTILAFGFPGCEKEKVQQKEKAMTQKTIQKVLKAHTPELMSIPGVIGTAIGEKKGEACITVLVIKKTPELVRKIPSRLEGYPVVIQKTGEIKALDTL